MNIQFDPTLVLATVIVHDEVTFNPLKTVRKMDPGPLGLEGLKTATKILRDTNTLP
jgi:hypothetical protein